MFADTAMLLICCQKLTHADGTHYQATEAETKEDREIICEEVFCDITGQLDFVAKGVPCWLQLL